VLRLLSDRRDELAAEHRRGSTGSIARLFCVGGRSGVQASSSRVLTPGARGVLSRAPSGGPSNLVDQAQFSGGPSS
jgi:hypothetical protein